MSCLITTYVQYPWWPEEGDRSLTLELEADVTYIIWVLETEPRYLEERPVYWMAAPNLQLLQSSIFSTLNLLSHTVVSSLKVIAEFFFIFSMHLQQFEIYVKFWIHTHSLIYRFLMAIFSTGLHTWQVLGWCRTGGSVGCVPFMCV